MKELMNVCVNVYVNVRVRRNANVKMNVHVHVCVRIYICVCVHIQIYVLVHEGAGTLVSVRGGRQRASVGVSASLQLTREIAKNRGPTLQECHPQVCQWCCPEPHWRGRTLGWGYSCDSRTQRRELSPRTPVLCSWWCWSCRCQGALPPSTCSCMEPWKNHHRLVSPPGCPWSSFSCEGAHRAAGQGITQ